MTRRVSSAICGDWRVFWINNRQWRISRPQAICGRLGVTAGNRMPLGQSQCIPQACPGRWVNPRFWHRLIRFRHFCSGSLALASPNRTCRNHVPTFPQRSPPWLLATAACGGLRSTPDCRPRRTYLHLSYSYASPFGPALLVTQGPSRNPRPATVAAAFWGTAGAAITIG
jgi:hypothetical protein